MLSKLLPIEAKYLQIVLSNFENAEETVKYFPALHECIRFLQIIISEQHKRQSLIISFSYKEKRKKLKRKRG